MESGIYSITNLKNGKRYIGQTNNLKGRYKRHNVNLKNNKHPNEHLQYAYNMYGGENFKFEVLKKCPIDELDEEENYYIKLYDTTNREKGYNILEYATENPVNKQEVRDKISQSQKGKRHTEQWKAQASYWRRGKRNPMFGKPGTWKGKKFSKTHRENLAKSLQKDHIPDGHTLYQEWKKGQKKGKTTADLAKKYNCARSTIDRRIKKCGYTFESKNATQFFRVYIKPNKEVKQGFIYVYRYKDENKKSLAISSVNIEKLKEKVLAKGLEWKETT